MKEIRTLCMKTIPGNSAPEQFSEFSANEIKAEKLALGFN
jgi:hypothetical protein